MEGANRLEDRFPGRVVHMQHSSSGVGGGHGLLRHGVDVEHLVVPVDETGVEQLDHLCSRGWLRGPIRLGLLKIKIKQVGRTFGFQAGGSIMQ